MTPRGTLRDIWRRPLQLAALTAVGLLAALFGRGAWRVLAWTCLAAPLSTAPRYLCSRPPSTLSNTDTINSAASRTESS